MASIAASHGVAARQLKWYNPKVTTLKSGRLRPGQVVLVPSRAVVSGALDVPDPAIEIYGASTRSGARTHVVRRGETLGGIAKKYRTSVSAIVRLNRLKKQIIHPGQELVVRGAARTATTAKAKAPTKSKVTAARAASTKAKAAKTSSKAVAKK